MISELPLTIIHEIGSVVNVLASFGVFHGDLEELFHCWIVSVVVIFARIQHALWYAHLIDRL